MFFDALFESIVNLKIVMPFHSEHCILYLDRSEERRGLKSQSLALGEEAKRRET